jgi:hypothetical protein
VDLFRRLDRFDLYHHWHLCLLLNLEDPVDLFRPSDLFHRLDRFVLYHLLRLYL